MLTQNFTLQRTNEFLKILKNMTIRDSVRVKEIEYHEGRKEGEWQPFPENGYWGKNDTWYRFRMKLVIPEEYHGKYVRCRVITGRENAWNALNPQLLVYVNGRETQALDTNHHDFCVAEDAVCGTEYQVELEAYAGREYNNIGFQELPLRMEVSLYWHDSASEALYYDLYAAKRAADVYPEGDYRRIQIENYLTKALNMLDFRLPGSRAYEESVRLATEYMQEEFYGKYCDSDEVIANCIGHTHIDVAWMWRLEQTRAKAVRSFTTELALMDEYPEHRFSSSQPQLYQYVKEDAPEVYERIKERVKEGRWEVEGGMWLEADCNLTSGESLVRQILHGKRFMKEEFGVDSHVLWLPDVFGYSAALPQILKKTGIDTFVTSKIHWSETNHLPYDTFMWKGIDGTEVFTQFILCGFDNSKLGDGETMSTYVGQIMPTSLAKGWELYQQKNLNNEILMSFGYGDGGGGVTREMVEMNRRMEKGIPGVPRTRVTSIEDALRRIKKNTEGKNLPKWFGELYLEYHRGTYTSMAKNKKYNRTCEFLLQSVEALSVMDKLLLNGGYSKQELYQDWTTVLLNQFHDIIPGSSIREVYEDSEAQYQELLEREMAVSAMRLQHLAAQSRKKGIFVYNPAGVKRDGIAEIGEKKYYVKDIPAYGWKVVDAEEEKAENILKVSASSMENQFYVIKIDETGALTSIYDKANEREVLSGRGNVLESYDDHPRIYDNWELCNYYKEKMWEIDDVQEISCEMDDIAASILIRRKYLNSEIEQKITIYRDMDGIDFEFHADWHEHHNFIKVAFPVDILSDKATYEIQYGAVERPTHTNTSWDAARFEVCAHKWADYAEADYGVAMLNDCKYGHDIHDGVMRLSLIKCGTYPNPKADQGMHSVRYSILPHSGDWRSAQIANRACAFNCPLQAVETEGNGTLAEEYSIAVAADPSIIITAVKEACEGEDIIIRAYESQGRRVKTALRFGMPCKEAEEVDMLEQAVYEKPAVEGYAVKTVFKPYEIKTFRIKI